MLVKTRNSTYEIEDGKIRCISTRNDPDHHTGASSEWRKCLDTLPPRIGSPLRIFWLDETITTTSNIVDIEDDEPELGWAL